MGAGVSAAVASATKSASQDEIAAVLKGLDADSKAKLRAALSEDLPSLRQTEYRAITLKQLRDVGDTIIRRCETEGWEGKRPIGPLGEDGRPTWLTIELTPEQVTLYDLNELLIKPMTKSRSCSYVELVASGPQRPKWFVSHWWGEPVQLFLRCLERHAADHGLPDDTAYWVCAYANNQHDVDSDVTADPSQSSFVKAIELAEGRVVSVLDEIGVTYTRAWCCLEIFLGLGQTYEMYTAKDGCEAFDHTQYGELLKTANAAGETISSVGEVLASLPIVSDRRAVGLTDGPCGRWGQIDAGVDLENPSLQTLRQASFPLDLVHRACQIRVQGAAASVDLDRRHILNYIVDRRGADLELPVLAAHPKYDETNARLHGVFVSAGWRLLLESGEEMSSFADILAKSGLRTLSLSFRGCVQFDDEQAQLLADSFPSTLEELRLEFAQSSATAASGTAALKAVAGRIKLAQLRELSFIDCLLTSNVPVWLGQCRALVTLILDNNRLSGCIPEALGNCIALQVLYLHYNALTGDIPASLGKCTELRELRLHDNQLSGSIPEALGDCTAMRKLRLEGNQLTGHIPESIGRCRSLNVLSLSNNRLAGSVPEALCQCSVLQEMYLQGNPSLSSAVPCALRQSPLLRILRTD